MAMLVAAPSIENRLLAERRAAGADRYDEVWDGVYVMSPDPGSGHQRLLRKLTAAFDQIVGANPRIEVFPGINITDREDDWTQNYRVPDLAVYLENTPAKDHESHWFGGPDFAIEIISPHDRSREKFAFYAKVGVRELLLIDRDPWALELFRLAEGELKLVDRIVPGDSSSLESTVLNVRFRLLSAEERPLIEITRTDGSQQWQA